MLQSSETQLSRTILSLKESARPSRTLVSGYLSTRRHVPERLNSSTPLWQPEMSQGFISYYRNSISVFFL